MATKKRKSKAKPPAKKRVTKPAPAKKRKVSHAKPKPKAPAKKAAKKSKPKAKTAPRHPRRQLPDSLPKSTLPPGTKVKRRQPDSWDVGPSKFAPIVSFEDWYVEVSDDEPPDWFDDDTYSYDDLASQWEGFDDDDSTSGGRSED